MMRTDGQQSETVGAPSLDTFITSVEPPSLTECETLFLNLDISESHISLVGLERIAVKLKLLERNH